MDISVYEKFSEVAGKMWWFRARRNIIEQIIKELIGGDSSKKILDFGAGVGVVSKMMANYADVIAVDNSPESVRLSSYPIQLISDLKCFDDNSFDIVTAFDVLEHCLDDEEIIKEFWRILKPGGFVFVAVPAYQFLWREYDTLVHHYRRYLKGELSNKFKKYSFLILKSSYYNTLLFPLLVVNVTYEKIRNLFTKKQRNELELYGYITNEMLFKIFNAEKYWLKKHNFPYGSSILLTARKIMK
ncbi:MAG: methyltransferase domain-containing protein [Candidatus Liptonbacteria bacterium]|nr:methyltransferase domain-containing protein [Candidatus Liptonbacteria bacterium]